MPFSNQKRYIISLLSSGYCANPACRKHLLENNKMIGEFCHIEGDKEGSARYNSNQTEVERNEPQNGIMLCALSVLEVVIPTAFNRNVLPP
jgi:hypothetical protein